MSGVAKFCDDGSGWRQVSGDPVDLPAEVFRKADEVFAAADDGTLDVSDFCTMDELRARIEKRRAAGSVSEDQT